MLQLLLLNRLNRWLVSRFFSDGIKTCSVLWSVRDFFDFSENRVGVFFYFSEKVRFVVNTKMIFCYNFGAPLTIFTWKTCVLLNSVQKFIEMQGWLLLTFFICLHNQLSSFNSIIVQMSEKRDSSNRQ